MADDEENQDFSYNINYDYSDVDRSLLSFVDKVRKSVSGLDNVIRILNNNFEGNTQETLDGTEKAYTNTFSKISGIIESFNSKLNNLPKSVDIAVNMGEVDPNKVKDLKGSITYDTNPAVESIKNTSQSLKEAQQIHDNLVKQFRTPLAIAASLNGIRDATAGLRGMSDEYQNFVSKFEQPVKAKVELEGLESLGADLNKQFKIPRVKPILEYPEFATDAKDVYRKGSIIMDIDPNLPAPKLLKPDNIDEFKAELEKITQTVDVGVRVADTHDKVHGIDKKEIPASRVNDIVKALGALSDKLSGWDVPDDSPLVKEMENIKEILKGYTLKGLSEKESQVMTQMLDNPAGIHQGKDVYPNRYTGTNITPGGITSQKDSEPDEFVIPEEDIPAQAPKTSPLPPQVVQVEQNNVGQPTPKPATGGTPPPPEEPRADQEINKNISIELEPSTIAALQGNNQTDTIRAIADIASALMRNAKYGPKTQDQDLQDAYSTELSKLADTVEVIGQEAGKPENEDNIQAINQQISDVVLPLVDQLNKVEMSNQGDLRTIIQSISSVNQRLPKPNASGPGQQVSDQARLTGIPIPDLGEEDDLTQWNTKVQQNLLDASKGMRDLSANVDEFSKKTSGDMARALSDISSSINVIADQEAQLRDIIDAIPADDQNAYKYIIEVLNSYLSELERIKDYNVNDPVGAEQVKGDLDVVRNAIHIMILKMKEDYESIQTTGKNAPGIEIFDPSKLDPVDDYTQLLGDYVATYKTEIDELVRLGQTKIPDVSKDFNGFESLVGMLKQQVNETDKYIEQMTDALDISDDKWAEAANGPILEMQALLQETTQKIVTLTKAYNEMSESQVINSDFAPVIADLTNDLAKIAALRANILRNINNAAQMPNVNKTAAGINLIGASALKVEGNLKTLQDVSNNCNKAFGGIERSIEDVKKSMATNPFEDMRRAIDGSATAAVTAANFIMNLTGRVNDFAKAGIRQVVDQDQAIRKLQGRLRSGNAEDIVKQVMDEDTKHLYTKGDAAEIAQMFAQAGAGPDNIPTLMKMSRKAAFAKGTDPTQAVTDMAQAVQNDGYQDQNLQNTYGIYEGQWRGAADAAAYDKFGKHIGDITDKFQVMEAKAAGLQTLLEAKFSQVDDSIMTPAESMQALNSAMETLKGTFVKELMPGIQLVVGALTTAARIMDMLPGPIKTVIGVVLVLGAGLFSLASILNGVASSFQILVPMMGKYITMTEAGVVADAKKAASAMASSEAQLAEAAAMEAAAALEQAKITASELATVAEEKKAIALAAETAAQEAEAAATAAATATDLTAAEVTELNTAANIARAESEIATKVAAEASAAATAAATAVKEADTAATEAHAAASAFDNDTQTVGLIPKLIEWYKGLTIAKVVDTATTLASLPVKAADAAANFLMGMSFAELAGAAMAAEIAVAGVMLPLLPLIAVIAAVGAAVFYLIGGFEGMGKIVNTVSGILKGGFDLIASAFKPIIDGLSFLFGLFTTVFGGIGNIIVSFCGGVLQGLLAAVHGVFDPIMEIVGSLMEVFGTIFGLIGEVIAALNPSGDGAGDFFKVIAEAAGMLGKALGFLLALPLWPFIAALKVIAFVVGAIAGAFSGAAKGAKPLIDAFGLLKYVMFPILIPIQLIMMAFDALTKGSKGMGNALSIPFELLKIALFPVLIPLNLIMGAFQFFMGNGDKLGKVLSLPFKLMSAAVKMITSPLEFIKNVFLSFIGILNKMSETVGGPFTIIKQAVDMIVSPLKMIYGLFTGLAAASAGILNAITSPFKVLLDAIDTVLNNPIAKSILGIVAPADDKKDKKDDKDKKPEGEPKPDGGDNKDDPHLQQYYKDNVALETFNTSYDQLSDEQKSRVDRVVNRDDSAQVTTSSDNQAGEFQVKSDAAAPGTEQFAADHSYNPVAPDEVVQGAPQQEGGIFDSIFAPAQADATPQEPKGDEDAPQQKDEGTTSIIDVLVQIRDIISNLKGSVPDVAQNIPTPAKQAQSIVSSVKGKTPSVAKTPSAFNAASNIAKTAMMVSPAGMAGMGAMSVAQDVGGAIMGAVPDGLSNIVESLNPLAGISDAVQASASAQGVPSIGQPSESVGREGTSGGSLTEGSNTAQDTTSGAGGQFGSPVGIEKSGIGQSGGVSVVVQGASFPISITSNELAHAITNKQINVDVLADRIAKMAADKLAEQISREIVTWGA